MNGLSWPEQTRAPLDDVQRERETVAVRGQNEGCAGANVGPRECVGPRAREEDDVERREAWAGAHEPRAAGAEGIFAGRRHDAQDQGAELG